jgi:poly(3-hydroxybutyrate) depolymerase
MRSKLVNQLLLTLALASACTGVASAQRLPSFSIQANRIFVAGISSGAAMAVQLNVAYSATFKGAALYAGVPYYCAGYGLFAAERALAGCSTVISGKELADIEKTTRSWANQGLIDPVANLKSAQIYLWSGGLDTDVPQRVVNELEVFYHDFGANVFHYDNQFSAGHGWESPFGVVPCSSTSAPFINLCYEPHNDHVPYDSEGVWLAQFFGPLSPSGARPPQSSLLTFDQNQFAPGGAAGKIDLADEGYAFVPQSCTNGASCGLILALHGCEQSSSWVGNEFAYDAGINEWAESNGVVVLYPQAAASFANPLGCWDWWGYLDDRDYAQKAGPQMKALYQMVVRASGGAAANTTGARQTTRKTTGPGSSRQTSLQTN